MQHKGLAHVGQGPAQGGQKSYSCRIRVLLMQDKGPPHARSRKVVLPQDKSPATIGQESCWYRARVLLVQDKSPSSLRQESCWYRARVLLVQDKSPSSLRQESCWYRTRVRLL